MSLVVLDPGPLSTVQDGGRTGWAHLGVPRAGFLDAESAGLANRLVGNAPDEALLETTLGGVVLRATRTVTVAVTGARCDVRVGCRSVGTERLVVLRAGAVLTVGPAWDGVRSYVAVCGGFRVEPVLGSRSTDTLSWTGPAPLARGHELVVGEPYGALPAPDVVPPPRRTGLLRLHPGPRADWLLDPTQLHGRRWQVGDASDRIGLRLLGEPVVRRTGELASEGMVLGAVQLPPSGELVVFLNDHPATGGYPVVAVLEPRDLAECAWARPGEELTSLLVGGWGRVDEAQRGIAEGE